MPKQKAPTRILVGVELSAVARAHDDGWLRAVAGTHVGVVEIDDPPVRRVIAFADPEAAEAFCAAVTHDGRFDVATSAVEIPVARRPDETVDDDAVARR